MIRIGIQDEMRSMAEGTSIEAVLDDKGTVARAVFMDMRDPRTGTRGCRYCVWSTGTGSTCIKRSLGKQYKCCMCETTVPVKLDDITGDL